MIRYAGLSDRGLVRENNEDNWSADDSQGLFIVSDGVGGQFAGELASKIVVQTLPPLLHERLAEIVNWSEARVRELLIEALCGLSNRVRAETKGEAGLEGLGATVVLALIRDASAFIAHMGDSRAYLLRGGTLKQLTKDHSIVQLLMENGEITPEQASTHPSRGQLTRNVGMPGEPLPEARSIAFRPGDRLLLCTDGLTGMLTAQDIRRVLDAESEPETACQRLIDVANMAGGLDNITAVVIDFIPTTATVRTLLLPAQAPHEGSP
jgi:PPM family protein phosphatase